MRPKIVIAYDASPAGADGLVLGRMLAELHDADLLVARVMPDTPSTETTDRGLQATFRTTMQATREAAAVLLGGRPFELWPVFGTHVAEGIGALAADRGADLIVFGSPHHGLLGQTLLGNAAEAAIEGAPCAVAVAPRGYRKHDAVAPSVIGVAFDGSMESAAAVRAGATMARSAGAKLRVITVEPAGWSRPIRHHEPVAAELSRRCAELEDGLDVEPALRSGDPGRVLTRESDSVGLLVCGSRARGPLSRVMLGSVSSHLVRSASCPVVVVPRRALHPTDQAIAASVATFTRS
jgi:nucleotide-binding universal stress UspA family protein